MDVVNLIYGLGDDFGMLMSSTWSGELYKRILDSGEVCASYFLFLYISYWYIMQIKNHFQFHIKSS